MKIKTELIFTISTAALLLLATEHSNAQLKDPEQNQWALCKPWGLAPIESSPLDHDTMNLQDPSATQMSAEHILAHDKDFMSVSGNVHIRRDSELMIADQADYHSNTEQLNVLGNLRYQTSDSLIYADRGEFNSKAESGRFINARYFFENNHASGYAALLEKDENQISTLQKSSYTSCNPDKVDWEFKASEIRLDEGKGFGTAKHTRLYFKNVPIFYFPYISFPIDDRRKSGFLMPDFGRSGNRGTEIMVPYYWNIAPQADATLALHNMTRRGLQFASEWRYLSKKTFNQLHYEYLDDELKHEKRSLLNFSHSSTLPWQWRSSVSYVDLSDPEYYVDGLSNDLSEGRQSTLQQYRISSVARQASVFRSSENWSFSAQTLDYIMIDENIGPEGKPYTLLPRLSLNGSYYDLPGRFDFEMQNELTYFSHDIRGDTSRLDVYPRISRTFGSPGWFVTPNLGIRYTSYTVQNPNNQTEEHFDRTVPIFSLDSGLIFERAVGHSNQRIQTLEPRLYYLNVPYRDQARIPIYDTRALSFSYAQLFRDNSFIGPDRVQDAKQVSLAISSRILHKGSGSERFRASIGRTFYSEDRRVTLGDDSPQIEPYSNIISEISASIGKNWSTKLNLEWNSQDRQIEKGSTNLRYKLDNNHIVNFGYQFRRDILEQSEVVWRWPLSRRWTSIAKWQYSLREQFDENNAPLIEKHDIETFFGLEYESCCYVFRAIGRRYLKPIVSEPGPDRYDTEILLQFSFKGFTQFGDDAGDLMLDNVIGYEEIY